MTRPYVGWTESEDMLLGTLPDGELANILGRTVSSITGRRNLLRIRLRAGVPGNRTIWTGEMKFELGTKPDEELAILWGVPVAKVSRQRQRLTILKYPAETNRRLFSKGLRICSACNECKPLGEYNKHPGGRGGFQAQCKTCRNMSLRRRSRELKRTWTQEMGGKCARCGYDEFLTGLTFHHVGTKDDRWGNGFLSAPPAEVQIELDQCVLLCACCHNALHAAEYQVEFEKRNGLGWRIRE